MRWFSNRKYKSGTGFCLWRWTEVDSKYIVRLHVLKTPWFAICLHWILKPDAEPYLHDHPVSFLSVILRGGYAELRKREGQPLRYRVHRWFNWIRATPLDKHRIIFARKSTLTLCFMGAKTREWGFHTDEGWIHWKRYYEKPEYWRNRHDVVNKEALDRMYARLFAVLTDPSWDDDTRTS